MDTTHDTRELPASEGTRRRRGRPPGGGTMTSTGLTLGEIDVIAGYAAGLTKKEIALDLKISPETVHTRTQRACARLGIRVGDRGHRAPVLVDYAYRNGCFEVDEQRAGMELIPSLLETLRCLARGLGHRATARELKITRQTAKQYRRRLAEVMRTESASRAVALGWETGLLRTDETTLVDPPRST